MLSDGLPRKFRLAWRGARVAIHVFSRSDVTQYITSARGEDLAIFDVRHAMEFHADPRVIQGAVYAPLEGWKEEDYSRIKDQEVIVYCG